MFISVIKQDRRVNFIELRSNTIAKRIKLILEAGGVDISKFQSHILRHVSINSQVAMGKNLDEVLSRACVSSKVYSTYYKLPFNASTASAPEAIVFEPDRENQAPDFELLTEQVSTSTATSSTSTSRQALRISNAGGGRKRRRTAAATAVT